MTHKKALSAPTTKKLTGLAAISTMKSMDDVRAFFKALNRKLGLAWHPDTLFEDYLDARIENGISEIFTAKEASRLNRLMLGAFQVCEKHKFDIYQLAYDMSYNMRRAAGIGITKRTKKS